MPRSVSSRPMGFLTNASASRSRTPSLDVAVRAVGQGPPLLFVHGSGMSAATWAPLLGQMPGHRLLAVDLPGFGLSDPHSYTGRSLRAHAVAQLTSLLDALDLERVRVVGTSLGAMWALCLALDAPERVDGVVALGVPAVCLPGMTGDAYFRLMTTPVLRALISRAPAPSSREEGARRDEERARRAARPRRSATSSTRWSAPAWRCPPGGHRCARTSTSRCAVAALAPRTSSPTTSWAASRRTCTSSGATPTSTARPRSGSGRCRSCPHARLDVIPGNHAPFLDDPRACARLIRERQTVDADA